jgi:uncharacterized protein (TIGR02145 family)
MSMMKNAIGFYMQKKLLPGIPLEGWSIPTQAEWQELADSLGASGNYSTNSVGGKLKQSGTVKWESPNIGATNESGLTVLPGGQRNAGGSFNYLQAQSYLWSSYSPAPDYGSGCALFHDNAVMECSGNWWFPKNTGASARLIKNDSNDPIGIVRDWDGNTYRWVRVGSQIWFKENYKCTHFNDGSEIQIVTGDTEWAALSTPGMSWQNNAIANKSIYGGLYNWYFVNHGL